MPQIPISTDAYIQSPGREFDQSPGRERKESGGFLDYVFENRGTFRASHGRARHVGYPPGAAARCPHGEVFMRKRRKIENTNDPTYGGATDMEYIEAQWRRTDGSVGPNSGDVLIPGPASDQSGNPFYTTISAGVTSDSSGAIVYTTVRTDGVNTFTLTETYDEPYSYDDFVADLEAIVVAQYSTWEGGADNVFEAWCYNAAGSVVSGDWSDGSHGAWTGGWGSWMARNAAAETPPISDNGPLVNLGWSAWRGRIVTTPTLTAPMTVKVDRLNFGDEASDDPPEVTVREIKPLDDSESFIIAPDIDEYHYFDNRRVILFQG